MVGGCRVTADGPGPFGARLADYIADERVDVGAPTPGFSVEQAYNRVGHLELDNITKVVAAGLAFAEHDVGDDALREGCTLQWSVTLINSRLTGH